MRRYLSFTLLPAALALSLSLAGTAIAAPREDSLAGYAAAAQAADPAFKTFAAERGRSLHAGVFAGGKPDTPACTSCHGKDVRAAGSTPTGKAIAPMALSVSPERYADPAKIEKWFKRNCQEVLGRECTAREKGDWLTFMLGQ